MMNSTRGLAARALVFSGQGTYRKEMGMNVVTQPPVAALWTRIRDSLRDRTGINMQEVLSENPRQLLMFPEAIRLDDHSDESAAAPPSPESRQPTLRVEHESGVMALSFITQPAVVTAHMLLLESLKTGRQRLQLSDFACVAGHSLGEFSALAALGVFSPEDAVELVFRRGLLMDDVVPRHNRARYRMYACNPSRAQLDADPNKADDIFFVLVELIARALSHTTSLLEVCNYNLSHEQYVVSGDAVALAVLGKCLDPQFRANCGGGADAASLVRTALRSVNLDTKEGVAMPTLAEAAAVGKGAADFVTSAYRKYGTRATFRRFVRGPDDGYTPSTEQLEHLSLDGDGRSGLKKKSWFIPLVVEVPFHSSVLRRNADRFLPSVLRALPEEGRLRELLSLNGDGDRLAESSARRRPLWVTNLNGRVFDPFDPDYQTDTRDMMRFLNVGENPHKGRYASSLIGDTFSAGAAEGSVRDMCAAVLAAQFAHPVQWIDAMNEMVVTRGCREVLEVAPSRNVSEMFKRAKFVEEDGSPITLKSCITFTGT